MGLCCLDCVEEATIVDPKKNETGHFIARVEVVPWFSYINSSLSLLVVIFSVATSSLGFRALYGVPPRGFLGVFFTSFGYIVVAVV